MVRREVVILGLALLGSSAALADQVSLVPMADTTLYESATGSSANGAGTAMFAGRNSGGTNSFRRALLRFDFSSIPAGSVITNATLTLNNSSSNVGPSLLTLHTVSNSWGEGPSIATGGQGGGTASQPGDATWIHRSFNSTFWTNPGGDFTAASSAMTTVSGPGFYDWTGPGLVADVQSFLDSPATNFGWILLGDEVAASSAKRFSTREEPNQSLRPSLVVTYVVPAPAGVCALACVAGFALRRRRS